MFSERERQYSGATRSQLCDRGTLFRRCICHAQTHGRCKICAAFSKASINAPGARLCRTHGQTGKPSPDTTALPFTPMQDR